VFLWVEILDAERVLDTHNNKALAVLRSRAQQTPYPSTPRDTFTRGWRARRLTQRQTTRQRSDGRQAITMRAALGVMLQ
jgi:hypothetical protein